MPIYEYACTSCDHTLDALQKVVDEPLVDCPECGKPALKRLLSAPSFRLKAQGWYETDFKKDKQRNLHGDQEDKPKKDKDSGDKGGTKGEDKAKPDTAGSKKSPVV